MGRGGRDARRAVPSRAGPPTGQLPFPLLEPLPHLDRSRRRRPGRERTRFYTAPPLPAAPPP